MNLEQTLSAVGKHRACVCAVRFFLAAILSGSQIFGGYAPFGLALVAAAGAGMEGLSALLGLLVGSLLFLPFTAAMRYIASGILILSVSIAFYDTKICKKAAFLPLTAAVCTAAVGLVYLFQATPPGSGSGYCLLEILLAGSLAPLYHTALSAEAPPFTRQQLSSLFCLGITLLIAVAAIPLAGFLSLGRIFAMVLVLCAGRLGGRGAGCACGLCAGLAMDAAAGSLYFSAAYGISAVLSCAVRCGRALYTLLFLFGAVLSLIWADSENAVPILMETAVSGILFLLLPEKWFRKARTPRPETTASIPKTLERQLRSTATVFRDLYDSLTHTGTVPVNDENIALVFDRAADQVCRACPLCGTCWDKDYVTTYNALNDATGYLTDRGRLLPSDLPSHFTARCVRLPDFTAAVNAEFTALLLRRQYTRQLDSTRRSAKEQYARLSELLTESADQISRGDLERDIPAAAQALPECEVCTASRPKAGENVSGDTVSTFRTEDGKVFLLLSDGMGCGEAARRESAMTVRLLEQFLKAGIEPPTALKTLNTALTLHSDENGSFTTIDLMALTPLGGTASFYKYGAAPSYIKHGESIRRVTGSVLPAGLTGGERIPDATTLCLIPGDFVVLVSDGFVDSTDDAWLQTMLSQWDGVSAQSLASALMDASTRRSGRSDDASLLILHFRKNTVSSTKEV